MLQKNVKTIIAKVKSLKIVKQGKHLLSLFLKEKDVIEALLYNDINLNLLTYEIELIDNENITFDVDKIINKAVFTANSEGKNSVNSIEFFIAIVSCSKDLILSLFRSLNINKKCLKQYIIDQNKHYELQKLNLDNNEIEFCINMTALIKKKPKVIGREYELERLMRSLARKEKNSPLLVGEPGVGKTAIVSSLVYKLSKNNPIGKKTIYQLNLSSLLAGAKYRGDFEQRIDVLLGKFINNKNAILFVDEIHTLMGAGTTNQGNLDAANLLKPALANGSLRVIGATTFAEYNKYIKQDLAFARRLQKIDVAEPTKDQTISILKGLKSSLEDFHKVSFTEKAFKTVVDIADKFIHDAYFPDKAIDLIDEAAAMTKFNEINQVVCSNEVLKAASEVLKVPLKTITESEKNALKNLEQKLNCDVFGQENAIRQVVDVLKVNEIGLSDDNKPKGSFMFLGSTGVGKTALAQSLANNLGLKLVRFDMSEYSQSHTVASLLGSPIGYEGYSDGGKLTNQILKNPNSIILFDEIEKAHSDFQNLMLQILDYGIITDSQGKKIDCKNTIIIFTSNLGVNSKTNNIGFKDESAINDSYFSIDEVNNFFKPEFRNRVDSFITFNMIDDFIAKKLLNKEIKIIETKLLKNNIQMQITNKAYEYLVSNTFNKKNGARGFKRMIKHTLLKPVVDYILDNNASKNIIADMKEDFIKISELLVTKEDVLKKIS
jgi:ATP-dependent Clp protease ATP-binding subunit ClpA